MQDEQVQNEATLVSGFLRAKTLSTMDHFSTDQSYIPLSAVIKAGLTNEKGEITDTSEEAIRIQLVFDRSRTAAQLEQIGLNPGHYTEVQQLILATACQEATNQIMSDSLNRLLANFENISSEDQKEQIRQLLKQLAIDTLSGVAGSNDLKFNGQFTTLTPKTLMLLQRKKNLFLVTSSSIPGLDIPDEELTFPADPAPALLPSPQRIMIFDHYIPSLILDPVLFSPDEAAEHQAKLDLLELYCTILGMTKNHLWQVNNQWLYQGNTIQLGDEEIRLPYSISQIMTLIVEELPKQHNACYKDVLRKVQGIATGYEKDWYTWIRNSLIGNSAAVKTFLNKVLHINVANEPSTSSSILGWFPFLTGNTAPPDSHHLNDNERDDTLSSKM